ncbi:XRE family transcriptional regulator [Erwinia sp. P6884]|uniref:helix-turn-helix domain-containing protein n=1 Tax=Erwinia sp. P6884 TaxID=3141450 RepID=UPI003189C447
MSHYFPNPGQTLKTLRLSRGWSLTLAAAQTGVSKAMLGQIERGESSPTVATLWKIATGFHVPFSLFIADILPQEATKVVRSGASSQWQQQNAAMRVAPLFPFDHQLGFDMLCVELAAGAVSNSSPHEAGVIEHVVVMQGKLVLIVNDAEYRLCVGEGLRFQADGPHTYRNDTPSTACFQSLIHYPQPRLPLS